MIKKLENNFSTFDLGLAAALISVDFELVSLDKQKNPRKVLFVFKTKSDIGEKVDDYFSGKLKASARALFDNTKMLKNIIFSSF